MKMNISKHFRSGLCTLAAVVLFAACSTEPVTYNVGQLPDEEALETVGGKLLSTKSVHERVLVSLNEGGAPKNDRIQFRLTQPALQAMNLTATADLSLVDAYNTDHGAELLPLPAANATIAANGALSVAAGARESNEIEITFNTDGLAAGTYLLPVVVGEGEAGQVLYYGVKVRGIELGNYELDTDYMHVFYLNTTDYQPLLADKFYFEQIDGWTWETVRTFTYGNIVNLRVTTLGYDEVSKRALFVLSSDMQYVVEHADKYIRPLQDKGRKVCFSIEGAGTGLGFCNLTDAQIADFTTQVKTAVEIYDIDGVNLFDRFSGYGKEGMPAMNTTSYPRLIKALREALGPDRLITVADYGKPTEYFWDTAATGGIAVGDYIDYAWSGYMDEDEDVQLLDPYQTITDDSVFIEMGLSVPTSIYDRKPIAGLDVGSFGHFALPWYQIGSQYDGGNGYMNIAVWKMMGYNPNNIVVWADLMTNQVGKYEGTWKNSPDVLAIVFFDGGMDGMYMYDSNIEGTDEWGGYGYMRKDW